MLAHQPTSLLNKPAQSHLGGSWRSKQLGTLPVSV